MEKGNGLQIKRETDTVDIKNKLLDGRMTTM